MKNNADLFSGTEKASSEVIEAWSEKRFLGWRGTERGHWRTAKGLGYSTPTPQAAAERGTLLLAATGKRGLCFYSLSFGLFGSLCLIKLNSPGQRVLTFNRSCKFYKLVTHTVSNLACGMPLLWCAAVKFTLEKFQVSGSGKSSPQLGAYWSASRRGVLLKAFDSLPL